MDDTAHYFHLGDEALNKLEGLLRQRESLETEIMKVEQFVAATANMLSGEHKDALLRRLSLTQELFRLREVGLTDAIRGILRISGTDWLTVTQVRDRMVSLGFDFSTYSSNPLASVSAVLRRFPLKRSNAQLSTALLRFDGRKEKLAQADEMGSYSAWIEGWTAATSRSYKGTSD